MKLKHTMDLTTGSVTRKLLAFAYPLLITNLLQHLYKAADNAVVGRFAGGDALAAVGTTGSATGLILNIIIGFATGATIVNSNLLGAGHHKTLRKSMHTSLLIALFSGLLVAVVGVFLAKPMLRLMKCPKDILDDATLYMRIILCGAPGTMLYNFGAGILRTHGDSKRPMMIAAVCGLVNVGLNLIFVLCLDMTVDGVAYATIISRYLSAASVMVILFNKNDDFKLRFREIKLHAKEAMNIIKIGLPCGLNAVVFNISNMIIQTGVNGFGEDVIAGGVAASNITTFLYQIILAFYSASVSFSGQCFGAKKFKRIDKVLFIASGISAATTVVISVMLTIWPEFFLSFFNTEPAVLETGTVKLFIVSWSYVLYAISEVCLACLRGMRQTVAPMIINIFCICIIRILWIFCVCPLAPDRVEFLYLCYPISYVFSMTLLGIFYWRTRRKLNKSYALSAT